METFNAAIDGFLKLLIGWAPPALGLTLLSAAAGLAMLWVVGKTSNQKRMKAVKRTVYAALLELRVFADEPAVTWRAQKMLFGSNMRYMRLALVPAVWLAVPMVLLIVHLESFYSRAPLQVGRAATITLGMDRGWDARSAPPVLALPEGVDVAVPPVRVQAERQISWRIVPRRPVSSPLVFRVGDGEIATRIEAGGAQRFIAARRAVSAPPVEWVLVDYPSASFSVLGVRLNWMVWFFAVSIVVALLLKKRFGVVI